jgi:hypothetical protein
MSDREEQGDEIEKLKKKLYSRAGEHIPMNDIRSPLSPKEVEELPKTFQKPPEEVKPVAVIPTITALMATKKKKMSFAVKFFIASIAFFVIAAGVAVYLFLGGGNIISPQNIDMQVVAPSLVDSGKVGSIQIVIGNRNTADLTLVDALIDYPEGTRDPADPTKALTHVRRSIGTIASGQQYKDTADGIFYGAEGSEQKVKVTLQYNVAGSNAVFEKSATADFRIGSSPISLSINTPDDVIAGQSFPVDITVQSNATTPLQNVVVLGQYPFGFTAQTASPVAVAGGTFWQLGTMKPGDSKTIHLTGTIDGQEGDTRVLRFVVGSNTDSTDTTIEVPVLTVPQTVTVRKPFISAQIAINGQIGKSVSVGSGGQIQGTVQWKNNLTTAVSNAQFVLTLKGPAIDKNSVGSAAGFYDSGSNTITWSTTQDPSLANIPPGGTGSLAFSFSALAPGSGGTLITNPNISLSLGVQGTRQDGQSAPQSVASIATANVSLASQVSLGVQALHLTGPVPGVGPLPPQAEKETSYTIQWTVKNSSNTVSNAVVSTILPPYVRFVSAGQSGISYDTLSRTVTWNLSDITAGIGFSLPQKQTYFQVVLTPSASQVGSAPSLTGPTKLRGQDRYADVTVSANAESPTTALTEAGFASGMDVVAPKQ